MKIVNHDSDLYSEEILDEVLKQDGQPLNINGATSTETSSFFQTKETL